MVETLVKLIINIEEGWLNYFIYKVLPLRRYKYFPAVLAVFANYPHWFRDHYDEIVNILHNYDNFDIKMVRAFIKSHHF